MAPLKVSEKERKEENPLSLVWMKGLPSEDGRDSSAGAGKSSCLTILQKTNFFADTDTSERQRSKNQGTLALGPRYQSLRTLFSGTYASHHPIWNPSGKGSE